MHALGGEQGKAGGQVETHLAAENAQGARPRPIVATRAVVEDIAKQVQVLPLWASRGDRLLAENRVHALPQ